MLSFVRGEVILASKMATLRFVERLVIKGHFLQREGGPNRCWSLLLRTLTRKQNSAKTLLSKT